MRDSALHLSGTVHRRRGVGRRATTGLGAGFLDFELHAPIPMVRTPEEPCRGGPVSRRPRNSANSSTPASCRAADLRYSPRRSAAASARRRAADARPPSDVLDSQALGREQYDPGALDVLERAGVVAGDLSQPLRVGWSKEQAYRLNHSPDSHASPHSRILRPRRYTSNQPPAVRLLRRSGPGRDGGPPRTPR